MQTLKKVSMELTHSLTHSLLKLSRNFGRFRKKFLVFLSTFSLLASQLFSILIPNVYAASSPWSQTDWVGGSGQTSWSDSTKYSTGSNITDSTAGQVTLSATSGWCNNASCDSSWKYRKKITFNNTDANLGVTSENLVNFPVLVKLSSSNLDYTKTKDSGEDIRFTDTDGSDLAYEIEKWDETGTSWVWVKIPQIDINSSTDYIYLYYGNTSATDHQQATSVWNSNYKLVQHLKETSGTTVADSTSNGNNGTKVSSTEPNPTSSGQINGAQDFDGINDYIDLGGAVTTGVSVTLSAWINITSITGADLYTIVGIGHAGSTDDIIRLFYRSSGFVAQQYDGSAAGDANSTTSGTSAIGQWVHVAGVFSSNSSRTIYINGRAETTETTGVTALDTQNYTNIGRLNWSTLLQYPKAKIDEVRISNSARSAAWIAGNYKSETDAFNTFNSEEERYVSSGILTSSIFDSEQQSNWGTLTYNTDGVATTAVKARTSNSSSMTGATDFTTCNAITSGTDISSNNCITDTHRYIQYQISLTSVSANTPTFQDISIAFTASDSTAPNVTLTALSPDPNTDTTPTLSGTVTEETGTVSNVQFQMDSTSGSWTACTADDGSFDEATETFTCTPSALSDGSHTMYVRATDSNSNTTASGSESSDTFTIDATAPTSIDLDGPGDNSYTNSERPTFKWKATTDATAGLSKYVLEIDNPSLSSGNPSGDFTIDDIPTSRTTDYETNKYIIHYENFSDSDSTNNYISVYTKSSSEWSTDSNSGQNDGKLREGKVSWKVKARDSVGNETSSSRTLFVDRTGPKVEFTQVNDTPFTSSNFSTTDKTPTIYGKITDPLSGGDSSQTQDENGPKIASGPKQVDIKVEKKEGIGYKLITLYTINMDKPWYSCDNKEVSDNSKQKCDKYLPFEYTSKENLDLGTYKITLTGKDKVDNSSGETTLTLNVTTLAQITTPEEKKIIEEEIEPLKPEEKEKVKEELEITKPQEPSALEKTVEKVATGGRNILDSLIGFVSNTAKGISNGVQIAFNAVGQGAKFVFKATGQALAFVGDKTGKVLAFVGHNTQKGFDAIGQGLAFAKDKTGEGLAYVGHGIQTTANNIGQSLAVTGKAIGDGYNQLAQNAPGVTKTILTGIGNGVSTATSTIASAVKYTADTTAKLAQNIASNAANAIVSASQNGVSSAKERIAQISFTIGEKTQDISDSTAIVFLRIGYSLLTEDTKISNVESVALSPTSVKITWKTNHPANGKVSWGYEDGIYKFELQESKRTTEHEFTLTNLQPDTEYHYEVMSQNKNYVYDANRKFKTPAVAGDSR